MIKNVFCLLLMLVIQNQITKCMLPEVKELIQKHSEKLIKNTYTEDPVIRLMEQVAQNNVSQELLTQLMDKNELDKYEGKVVEFAKDGDRIIYRISLSPEAEQLNNLLYGSLPSETVMHGNLILGINEQKIKQENYSKVIKIISKNSALAHASINGNHNTPLHFAAQYSVGFLRELFPYTKNIDVTNKVGETPLHVASYKDNVESVKELIAKGAAINKQNLYGSTPLHLALVCIRRESPEYILTQNANPNIQDNNGNTPLHAVMNWTCCPRYVALLLWYKADSKICNKKGKSAQDISLDNYNKAVSDFKKFGENEKTCLFKENLIKAEKCYLMLCK